MSYYGCSFIQMSALNFNGRIDTEEPPITLCCEGIPNIPRIGFGKTAEDTLRSFMGECLALATECKHISEHGQRRFSAGCAGCANFQKGDYGYDGLIHYINLSMYPAPCQSRCIYCEVHKNYESMTEKAKESYNKLFDTIELAQHCGLIASNATWQVSSGEIAIHPYHDRIMKLVQEKRAIFYTNCMEYDEAVAQNLHDNPGSAINLSIDAGTPVAWSKIKGIDNFEKVTENLSKYYVASVHPGQITLKYIILPDINDFYEEYVSLIEIMKVLKVKHLTIARDTRKKYNISSKESIKLIRAAAYLLAICHKNEITNDMFTYTPEERNKAMKQANEILRQNLI